LTQPVSPEGEIHPRQAYFRTFYNIFEPVPTPIDQGILLYYKKPKSFTGDDIIELQIHGGTAVKQRMLETLSKFPEFREA
jgi:tRNA modification GTPase